VVVAQHAQQARQQRRQVRRQVNIRQAVQQPAGEAGTRVGGRHAKQVSWQAGRAVNEQQMQRSSSDGTIARSAGRSSRQSVQACAPEPAQEELPGVRVCNLQILLQGGHKAGHIKGMALSHNILQRMHGVV
jgi:hypothetical protein